MRARNLTVLHRWQLLEVLRHYVVSTQKAAPAPEQPAKKRKLLSKKAATAPSLTQQRALARQAAPAGGGAAEAPEPRRRKAAPGKAQAAAQAAERQSEPCQTPQAGPPQVTRGFPSPPGSSCVYVSQSQHSAPAMPLAGGLI